MRAVLEATPGVVDVDDGGIAAAPRKLLLIDRRKAARLGVAQADIVSTLRAGLSGDAHVHARRRRSGDGRTGVRRLSTDRPSRRRQRASKCRCKIHHDLSAIAEAISPRTQIVFLANPNNPTGDDFSRRDEWEKFLAKVSPRYC